MRRQAIRLAARARRSLTNAAPTAASSSSTTTSSSAAASSASADATAELLTFAPSLHHFACMTAFAQNYVLSVMQCVGASMLPTVGLSGDVVLMWPTASGLITPQLGDVVICSSPTDPTSTVCKRVVGLPGDVVKYKRLPGMPELRETRPAHSRDGGRKSRECIQQVPRGQVWLQGDNSADSCDSRYYGPVPMALVRGIVFVKLWPFTEAGVVSGRFRLSAERFVEQDSERRRLLSRRRRSSRRRFWRHGHRHRLRPLSPRRIRAFRTRIGAIWWERRRAMAMMQPVLPRRRWILLWRLRKLQRHLPATAAANSAAGPVVHPANR